jgi:hypothetical protein
MCTALCVRDSDFKILISVQVSRTVTSLTSIRDVHSSKPFVSSAKYYCSNYFNLCTNASFHIPLSSLFSLLYNICSWVNTFTWTNEERCVIHPWDILNDHCLHLLCMSHTNCELYIACFLYNFYNIVMDMVFATQRLSKYTYLINIIIIIIIIIGGAVLSP